MSEQILSASKIKTWESCTWKYWCNYELKLPKSKNDGNVRGTTCHLILEVLLNPRHKKYIKKILKAKTIKIVPSIVRLVKKSLRSEGEQYCTPENYEMCDNMIVVGLNIDFLGGKGAKIDKPEEEFYIESKSPRYKIRGYIDKPVQYKGKKKLKIIDYKTNKSKFVTDEIEYNPQAFVYLLAAKQIWPKLTDTSIEFQFLKFPDDPCIEIKYTEEQLSGFEYWLEELFNKFNYFTEEDAKADFAFNRGFPKNSKKEGFVKRLNCGYAEYPGELKKNGELKWHCEYKFPYDYYAVVDENGKTLYSSKNKEDLKPEKNQTIQKKHYSGCPAVPQKEKPTESQATLESSSGEEDVGDFPF